MKQSCARNHARIKELQIELEQVRAQYETLKWTMERMIEDPQFAEKLRKKRQDVWKTIEQFQKAKPA
jgi:predicted RNase H-like nuclease (RuvC/YqgF family)